MLITHLLTPHDPLPQQNKNIRIMQERITMWKGKTLHERQAYNLKTPDVNKIALNAWLKSGKIFSETTECMIVIQDQVINTNNCKKHILKDICRKCREKQKPFNI
jgi:hypothetical protein